MMPELDALHADLLPIIRETTLRASMHDIVLQDDLDHDGDPILRIMVILEGASFRLDPVKTLETARRIRQRLLDLGDPRFPVVT